MAENENADLGSDPEAIEDAEHAETTEPAEPAESWLISLSKEFGRTFRWGKSGVDLVADATESALKTTTTITKKIVRFPRRDRNLSPSEEALFEELGAKFAECPAAEYRNLKNDPEFWELIKKLRSIRRKAVKQAGAEEEPQEEETADSSPEDSQSTEAPPEEPDAPQDDSFSEEIVEQAATEEEPQEEETADSSPEDSQPAEAPPEELDSPEDGGAEEPKTAKRSTEKRKAKGSSFRERKKVAPSNQILARKPPPRRSGKRHQ